ncbi:MAG: DUF1080 domain-containing protein [Planctomycetaceae bacterium]
MILHRTVVLLGFVFGFGLCGAGFCPVSAQDAFQPLFNGQDLSGWVLVNTPRDTWSIREGMLVCSGRPTGELRTERMYQNFILELEWRHMVPGGNAGIFVWADDITARGVPFHRSIEVQVLDHGYGQGKGHTTHGDIFPIHGATLTPVNGRGGSRAFPTEERAKASPEWNHYRIECRDGAISLAVNGKVVTRGTDASPRKGYICIESEGGTVQYRNLRIQELPETPVAPEHVAVSSRGYRSIYSGLNLRGWLPTAAQVPHWQAQDWTLNYDGQGAAAADAVLLSQEAIAERTFLVDVRAGAGCESVVIAGQQLSLEQLGGRDWARVELQVRSGRVSIQVNGKQVTADAAASQAAFSLSASGAAQFANIYVRANSAE